MPDEAPTRQRGPYGQPPATLPYIGDGPIDGALLRAYRLWHGLTQDRMAEEIGVHYVTYVSWETNRRKPVVGERALRNLLLGMHCRLRHAHGAGEHPNGATA